MADATNSRKIRIKRKGSFITNAQGKEVEEYYAGASQNIGSYWESSNSKRIASGLTMEEEAVLVPLAISVDRADREYMKSRDEFFAALEVKVPPKEGIEFEIGLEDNTKPVSKTNLPLDIHQYIRYRFASKHPWVSPSEVEARGNQLKYFFVHDENKAIAAAASEIDLQDKALQYYLTVKATAEKVNMMLTLLGRDYRDIVATDDASTASLRVKELRSLIDSRAADFIALHEDKDFDVKYTIQMLLNTQVLKRIGAKYLVTETGESLGTYEETVQWFKDDAEHSDQIAMLKAKLQEATKANKKAKRTVAK